MTKSMKSNRFVPYLLTCVIMLLAGVCASAQNISLSFKDAPLADVLHAMEEQTECSFIYETSDLSKAPKVTINVVDRNLSSVLDEIIKAPLGYEMKGKIVITSQSKQETPAAQPEQGAQQKKNRRRHNYRRHRKSNGEGAKPE